MILTDSARALCLDYLRTRNRGVLPVLADALQEQDGFDDDTAGALRVFRSGSGNQPWTWRTHWLVCQILGDPYAAAADFLEEEAEKQRRSPRQMFLTMGNWVESESAEPLLLAYRTVTGQE